MSLFATSGLKYKEGSIELLQSIDGNRYNWCEEKFDSYYLNYPYPQPTAVNLIENETVVAFNGILPCRIGNYKAGMMAHTFISPPYRDIRNINLLISKTIEVAKSQGLDMLVGFPNHKFNKILSTLFKWDNIGMMKFVESSEVLNLDKPFFFNVDSSWYKWKFNEEKDFYIKCYQKDQTFYHQLLKNKKQHIKASELGLERLSHWEPIKIEKVKDSDWTQPFVLKMLSNDLPGSIKDITNWRIEMGDSDSFEWVRK